MSKKADVVSLPYTLVLERALGWMTAAEVRDLAARVRAHGGFAGGVLDDELLAEAHPARVHAILQKHTPAWEWDGQPVPEHDFYEIRVWSRPSRRSFGCPLEATRDEVAGFPLQPDPVHHQLVAPMKRGKFTE